MKPIQSCISGKVFTKPNRQINSFLMKKDTNLDEQPVASLGLNDKI